MQPEVSVILPAYNAERFLKEAIDSVLEQTYSNFELIIINDGSTDNTDAIIQSYSDPRIVYIKQENQGLARALNNGIAKARGNFIARMDADDICMPTRFEKQVKYLQRHPEVSLLSTGTEHINEVGKHLKYLLPVVGKKNLRWLIQNRFSPISHPAAIIRHETLALVGGYNVLINKYFEDLYLWNRLLEYGEAQNLPKVLLRYRITDSAISSTFDGRDPAFTQFMFDRCRRGAFSQEDADEMKRLVADLKAKQSNQTTQSQRSQMSLRDRIIDKVVDIGGAPAFWFLCQLQGLFKTVLRRLGLQKGY